MTHALLFSARFVEGQYHGTADGFTDNEGWPPSPSRLFQAMVAASARGATISPENAIALKWFETLDPPEIVSPSVRKGRIRTLFVPNNDLDSQKGDPANVSKIRVPKDWRPYYFDANQPILYLYSWDGDSHKELVARVCSIAKDIYQLGKGIDIAWVNAQFLNKRDADILIEEHPGSSHKPTTSGNVDIPTTGTFDSLVNRYVRKRFRLQTVVEERKVRQEFTQPPRARFRRIGYGVNKDYIYFELRDNQGRFFPKSLSSAALVVTNIRDAGVTRLKKQMPKSARQIDRVIKGLDANASDLTRRIRIIPIPSIGSRYVEPLIRRVAIEIPPECPIHTEDLRWAFSGVQIRATPNEETAKAFNLVPAESDLMFSRYITTQRDFSSVTALALPMNLRRSGKVNAVRTGSDRIQIENLARRALLQSLRHAGVLAKPREVRIQREPFDQRGVRAESFALETRFPSTVMWHASMKFDDLVSGPLILGNGRYLGLGLMKPAPSVPQVIAFSIDKGLAESADPQTVADATRRAVMARFQQQVDGNKLLPSYISGHLDDGSPSKDEAHQHIAIVADLPRKRILIIAPHLLRRGNLVWGEGIKQEQSRLFTAIRHMDLLYAGKSGRLQLSLEEVDFDADPVFSSGNTWENVTDYHVTRHRRHDDLEQSLRLDLVAELRRCKSPLPSEIEILATNRGRGGGVSGKFRLIFSESIKGPLLLGRTMHKGGGLFARPSTDLI